MAAGDVNGDDELCIRFVKEANCVIASVNYRLAPSILEHGQ
ncbi:alpha/beta hydrolase fold domain-containing protein [Ectobacillus ponti]